MKKLLKHYVVEHVKENENKIHIFIYEISEKVIKKQQVKDKLAKLIKEKLNGEP